MPGLVLHGSTGSGSAAAPTDVPAPALTALAKTIPRPSKARRSIRPLPATNSGSRGVRLRYLSAMISSLEAVDAGLNIFKTAVKQSSG